MLITDNEFDCKKSRDDIPLKCIRCETIFHVKKHHIQIKIKNNSKKKFEYCSIKCSPMNQKRNQVITNCKHCNLDITRPRSQIKKSKSGNIFCSKSCSVTYNNIHKTQGARRSKLEKWIESKLLEKYPNLEIHFNRKDAINSELDIYIPSLKLAFELNGIFHYEPIHGVDKLSKIKNNDNRKFQACLERGIELCIVDTSQIKYLKEDIANKYLIIITDIIDIK